MVSREGEGPMMTEAYHNLIIEEFDVVEYTEVAVDASESDSSSLKEIPHTQSKLQNDFDCTQHENLIVEEVNC